MSSNKFIFLIAFIAGATAGSIFGARLTKRKYEQISEEEIKSVKEVFAKRRAVETTDAPKKPCLGRHSCGSEDEKFEPYVISPDDFGDVAEYETITLMYYSDGVLADDNDEIVSDSESLIGKHALQCFGEYEDDSVFVRNDNQKCDFEILLDSRKYSDIAKNR